MGGAFITFIVRGEKRRGFICGPGVHACSVCGEMAEALCDYPVGPKQTCDQPLCELHRIKQGAEWQDIDFCPTHALVASGQVRPPAPEQMPQPQADVKE